MKYKKGFVNLLLVLIIEMLCGCSYCQHEKTIVLAETAGVPRYLAYVKIKTASHREAVIFLRDQDSGETIRAEKLLRERTIGDTVTYILPITMDAYQKRTFSILNSQPEYCSIHPTDSLKVLGEGFELQIENEHFVADLSSTDDKLKRGLYPGQLSSLFLKKKRVLLKRDGNNMHWAPNFQKENSKDYKTIGHLNLDNAKITQNNPYQLELVKRGKVEGYGEIDLEGKYSFYAGLPYFIYSSSMEFSKDAKLFLLRNNEITMDKLFTHLIYPDALGKFHELPLYGPAKQLDSLSKTPLDDTINWVGFINKSEGFGIVSLILDYDNSSKNGSDSPLINPHVKITPSRYDGRYWDRRLIHNRATLVPKGSRYRETNAYLILDKVDNMADQIAYHFRCINNPIKVMYKSH
ncbi:hypothetical protein [Flagellimonas algicola]|uniref:DKNYY family protein n=1 Tax=Flagellimonas algicola TaxID=2583815 RepID=A0ABY2WH99_9FLAO|nr:hypothetical protein [Allomuricauda algicola]TMU50731.1 hypothetical protein FGG15_18195 [Allomuricauda algicola]